MFYFALSSEGAQLLGEGEDAIQISVDAPEPFNFLSSSFPHGQLPVFGTHFVAESLDAVWEGLKWIEGEGIDPSCFGNTNRKRGGNVLGYRVGDEIVGYLEAKRRLYIPGYHNMVYTYPRAFNAALSLLDDALGSKRDCYLYDGAVEEEPGVSQPLCAAAILVALLQANLETVERYFNDGQFRASYLMGFLPPRGIPPEAQLLTSSVSFPLADKIIYDRDHEAIERLTG
jgi:hypothetical protein